MTADEYVPSDDYMRRQYVVKRMHDGATRTHAEQEYTRWLTTHDARVRRDAAREALDGYAKREEEERFHHLHVNGESAEASKCAYAAMTVRAYLHLRYPEEVQ